MSMEQLGQHRWWIVGMVGIVAMTMIGFGYIQGGIHGSNSFSLIEPVPVYEVRIELDAKRVCLESTTSDTQDLMSHFACR